MTIREKAHLLISRGLDEKSKEYLRRIVRWRHERENSL